MLMLKEEDEMSLPLGEQMMICQSLPAEVSQLSIAYRRSRLPICW